MILYKLILYVFQLIKASNEKPQYYYNKATNNPCNYDEFRYIDYSLIKNINFVIYSVSKFLVKYRQ